MLRIATCLLACLCAASASAGSAEIASSGRQSVELVTEGLFDTPEGAETKSVGFEIGVAGPLGLKVRGAVEQTADPLTSDGGYASWTARLPQAPVGAAGRGATMDVEGTGTLSSREGYSQGVSATLKWTPRHVSPFLAGLQLENGVVVNARSGTVEVSTAPEWLISSHAFESNGAMRSELKARLELKHSFDGAPSAYAGFSLEIGPD